MSSGSRQETHSAGRLHRDNARKKHFNEINFDKVNSRVLDAVQGISKANARCCDCNGTENVEWVSTNLLCVLCIKCSGVHRSMGSHISKIRSLTLDSFHSNAELLYLIENKINNETVNNIYEAQLSPRYKITPQAVDWQRLNFITNKYKLKKYVGGKCDSLQESLKQIVKAIQLNSIQLLQIALAQSDVSLKKISVEFNATMADSLFQFTLKHNEVVGGKHLFFITEYLLINDMNLDSKRDNFGRKGAVTPTTNKDAVVYWKSKWDTFGFEEPAPGATIEVTSQDDSALQLSTQDKKPPPNKSNSLSRKIVFGKKRWSLGYIPQKSQSLLLGRNKSMKPIKDEHNS
ncbi:GTPase-activating protein AGE1 KNAG_0F00160 [Huiozyma naganishii CBS 8797]|uniref:ADP-ribosylation factor GTPase-activating protein n=1 Tax=Huiozyma naganishii (strain ATCC MYA-139 / BCRC 22969 / CBS 8797 / KCTC 17520 / NBRC 10181 / NCYC 3082 / Yp74L-3) TaxID=1071383 RepID=J7RMB9_HUIN7|nr:hypothetical protein KNAG_0F00160 [Kazachstania naganishii CBS 8797]CCK70688.1 hypothetical protein KNAG_0F00160 [Kazachstania naganishii CBS 8797]